MLLPLFDLATGAWDGEFPFMHTLAEAMFPDVAFALVRAGDDESANADTLAEGVAQAGFSLDFAGGGKKSGVFVMTDTPVAPTFWKTPEEAVAYGSILLTPCWGKAPTQVQLNVLVVEDGDFGTGDCHAKASTGLWDLINADVDRVAQFRLGVKDEGIIAKGTMMVDSLDAGDDLAAQGIDVVLPRSAFKSSTKPATGMYTWASILGVVAWSESRDTKPGYQVLQWFSYKALYLDLTARMKAEADKLIAAQSNIRTLVEYLKLSAAKFELPLLDVFLADEKALLSQHPYLIYKIGKMLRRRWVEIAMGGAQRWTGLQGIPNDDLPFGVIATNAVRKGDVIVTRFPLRSWVDLKVWKCVPMKGTHRGVVMMSHETAAALGGDFDGDYFIVTPADKYPNMTKEIGTWAGRPAVPVLKVKQRKESEWSQIALARVMLESTGNMVGQIALMIARANVAGDVELVAQLAQQLQVAVDKFKYSVDHDYELLETARKTLRKVTWVNDYKSQDAFKTRTMKVQDGEGSIGELIRFTNRLWIAPAMMERPISEFAYVLPQAERHVESALSINRQYGQMVAEALRDDDEGESLDKVYAWLDAVRKGLADDADEWVRAMWHVAHRKSATGRGSLAFYLFPDRLAGLIKEAEPTLPEQVAIVGLQYHAYKDADLSQFNGGERLVDFRLTNINMSDRMRLAAYVDGSMLGVVSSETPVPGAGVRRLKLTHSTKGKSAVVYAAPAA